MAYVEWLRTRNVLRVIGIIFVIFFVLSAIARLATQYVVQSGGHVEMGANNSVDLSLYFVFSMITGFIVATVLGTALANETVDHAEIAWMKPISREALAVKIFGADITGIVAAQVLAVITGLVCGALWRIPHLAVSAIGLTFIAVSLLAPIAWYALLMAATASMKQNVGMVIGVAWAAAVIIPLLAMIESPHNLLVQAFHTLMLGVQAIDPITYASVRISGQEVAMRDGGSAAVGVGMLALLAIVYGVAAILQWRRVEA